jgi:hypothetical protein
VLWRNQPCASAVPSTSPRSSGSNCCNTATTIPSPSSVNALPCCRSRTAPPPTPSLAKACSARATPTPSTVGRTPSSPRDSTDCKATSRAASAASVFDDRKDELQERLRHGPGPEAQEAAAATPQGPAPSRWTLQTIRASFDWLADYTLSGLRRLLDRLDLGLHSAKVQQFSPDPDYLSKRLRLMRVPGQARRHPGQVEAVFIDEMGYTRWPDPGPDYGGPTPAADRRGANNGLWRLIGGLNARTGRLDYLGAYVVGRAKVIGFYERLAAAYPDAERLYVIQDDWSIHTHPEVMQALERWPQVKPVWLPTYAPWLNPIEKVWRWLRQDVLKMHRLADDWEALQARVHGFLDQFADGSERLLEYVGLLGQGRLARMIHGP